MEHVEGLNPSRQNAGGLGRTGPEDKVGGNTQSNSRPESSSTRSVQETGSITMHVIGQNGSERIRRNIILPPKNRTKNRWIGS